MRTRLAALAVMLPLLLFPLYWTNAVRQHDFDDPYITYRYAENLATHHGFVYNPGLKLLSTTTPGYTILLACLSKVSPDMPMASNILGSLCLLLGACLLIDLLPHRIPLLWRVAAGFLLALMHQPLRTLGSEFPLYMLLILGSCWCYEREKPLAAGLAAGLATLIRPDGAVLICALLLAYIVRHQRANAVKAAAMVAAPLIPWLAFAIAYFGSPIPVTLAAKQDQVRVEGGYGFLRGLGTTLNFVRKDFGNVEFVLIGLLILAGVWSLTRRRPLPLLLQWAAIYIVGYSVIGVRYYTWYYAPLFSAGVWLLVVGLRELYEVFAREKSDGIRLVGRVAAACAAISLLPLAGARLYQDVTRGPESELSLYRSTADWLTVHTPPTATVGALQIGIIGYYSRRPIIDFAGLIQPDIHHAPGNAYVDWSNYAIRKYAPDYITLDTPWGNPIMHEAWFLHQYEAVQTLASMPPQGMVIYHRRDAPPPH